MKHSLMKKKIESTKATDIQKQIIEDKQYPRYLKAGAGSGKTEVLIRKIINIIKDEDISMDNFAIITFTNKATEEMKERINDRLYYYWLSHHKIGSRALYTFKTEPYLREQVEISNMVQISTIHSFCEKILRDYGLHIGIAPNFQLLSIKNEKNKIVNDVINKHHSNPYLRNIPIYNLKKLIELFMNDNNNKGFEFDEDIIKSLKFNSNNDIFWNEFKKAYCEIYLESFNLIEQYKKENNILETNDLIKKASELTEIDYVANKITEVYKYIFIDEFQDTNKNQFDLVKNLQAKGSNIFLVGDDKQSIYAFRGSDIENSRKMSKYIESLSSKQQIQMNDNFRTDYKLLEDINEIFSNKYKDSAGNILEFDSQKLTKIDKLKDNELSEYKPLQFVEESNLVDLIKYITTKEKLKVRENGKVKKESNGDFIHKNIKYKDICILFRSNYDLDNQSNILKEAGIPVEVYGGKGFYKSKEIIDTFKLFNSMINKDYIYEKETQFTDYYLAIKSNTNIDNPDEYYQDFIQKMKSVFRIESIEGILDHIYNESGILDYYTKNSKFQEIANLQKLKDISRNLTKENNLQPIQFLNYLNNMISGKVEEEEAEVSKQDKEDGDGMVSLYSIHKAKGLEFPVVIVANTEQNLEREKIKPKIIFYESEDKKIRKIAFKKFDNIDIVDKEYEELLENNKKESLEEELRILYVALTRAEYRLYILREKKASRISWWSWLRSIDNGKFIKDRILELNY